MKIAVLGGGALAQALWRELPRPILKWQRPGKLPDLTRISVILLAVSDDAIAGIAAKLDVGPRHLVAHLAGAVGLDALQSAAARGARTGSIHPLRAFVRGEPGSFRGAAAGISGSDARGARILGSLARGLGMKPLPIGEERRPLYHAAAVLSAGAQVALFSEAVRAFREATRVSERVARAALLPLTLDALQKLSGATPAKVITGSAVRGDAATVAAHRRALPEDLRQLYDSLGKVSVKLAREGRRVEAAKLDDVLRVLERPRR